MRSHNMTDDEINATNRMIETSTPRQLINSMIRGVVTEYLRINESPDEEELIKELVEAVDWALEVKGIK